MNKYFNVKNIVTGGVVVLAAVGGYTIGQNRGKAKLIKGLVDECMTHERRADMHFPVASVKKYGNLMFEISAECIGD